MSNALARMRNFFQDELLVQVGKAIVLTPLAQSLVQPVSCATLTLTLVQKIGLTSQGRRHPGKGEMRPCRAS
jgi:hypothetical protein